MYRANWPINIDSVTRSTRPPSIYSNQITAWYSWPGQTWRLNLISLTSEDCYGGTCGVWPLWSHEKSCFCKFIVHCKMIVLPPMGNLEANMSWVDQLTLSLAERLFSLGTLTIQVRGRYSRQCRLILYLCTFLLASIVFTVSFPHCRDKIMCVIDKHSIIILSAEQSLSAVEACLDKNRHHHLSHIIS